MISAGGVQQNVEGMSYPDVLSILRQGIRPVLRVHTRRVCTLRSAKSRMRADRYHPKVDRYRREVDQLEGETSISRGGETESVTGDLLT